MVNKGILECPHIDRVSNPPKEVFLDRYGFPGKPVVILDVMKNWKAMTRWTTHFFKTRYGPVRVKVRRSKNPGDERTLRLDEYMEYMGSAFEDDPYYLTDWHFHNSCPEILGDYEVPEYFKSWHLRLPIEIRPKWSWFYIGPANSGSKMHLDTMMTSAWNAVISGRKYWLFYHPEQEEYLYGGNVDAFNPDLNKYPLFAFAKPLLCIQNPGEIVFTPSGWWHQVFNEHACISITENFVNESNLDQVRSYLTKRKLFSQVAKSIIQFIPELNQ